MDADSRSWLVLEGSRLWLIVGTGAVLLLVLHFVLVEVCGAIEPHDASAVAPETPALDVRFVEEGGGGDRRDDGGGDATVSAPPG